MFFLVLIVCIGLVAAGACLATRKMRTHEPVREILTDWLERAAGRLGSAYWGLLAWRDRDALRGDPAERRKQLREVVDTKVRSRPVPAPPAFGPDSPAQATPAETSQVMNAPVPSHWAPVIRAVSGFEPEHYQEHLGFFAGECAGIVAYAEAWLAFAETQFAVVGIDPAAVQASMEAADSIGDCAHDIMLAQRRFIVVFAELIEAIQNGLELPHNARQFFSEGAA
jgi:hypothetical protein